METAMRNNFVAITTAALAVTALALFAADHAQAGNGAQGISKYSNQTTGTASHQAVKQSYPITEFSSSSAGTSQAPHR
jgi:hypothetical protein